MAQSAPKGQYNRAADFVHEVADCATPGNVDLTRIAEKPNHAAQRVRFFHNAAASASVTVTPELGAGQTPFNVVIFLPPHGDYTTEFPIKAIVTASTATVSAIVMWWTGGSLNINKPAP